MEFSSAVHVKDACKSYGSKPILKNLNLHVKKGNIYGLLGASGCGKTTLLSCIVGRRNLQSGEIWVLGGKPGTEGSGVPGPRVGFMPQDAALAGELTVEDSLYYFGKLMEMPDGLIKERFENLSDILDLPPKDRFVKNCSGGQKRRISFACSMVHMPELLILDEPTAGVDPVLRERIWNYLTQVTKSTNMAVIITTHYIEETRQADQIGLLRDGRLLAQDSPENLLTTFQVEYLEDVFLLLSKYQEAGKLKKIDCVKQSSTPDLSGSLDTSYGSTNVLMEAETNSEKGKNVSAAAGYTLNRKRMTALTDKNWKMFYRNKSGMIFTAMFPLLILLTFLLAVGQDVKSIPLAIVNEESTCTDFALNATAVPFNKTSCNFQNVGCRFLTYLNHPMIKQVDYMTLDGAFDEARWGEVVGVLHIAENFTTCFEHRFNFGRMTSSSASSEVISFGQIKVWLDMSNRQIGETMKYKLFNLYRDFQEDIIKDCNMDPENNNFINLETINGDKDEPVTIYMIPGAILTIMFFMANLNTVDVILSDKCEGVWDRAIVTGVSSLELILSHFVLQSVIVLIYTIEVLVIIFWVFEFEFVGSIWTMAVITYLQGVAGIFYGFFLSTISNGYTMANLMVTGTFFLMIFSCGFLWPLEGMPVFLRWFANSLPLTVAMQSFRNVMRKGWTINNFAVLNGIGIEIAWIFAEGAVTTFILKSQR